MVKSILFVLLVMWHVTVISSANPLGDPVTLDMVKQLVGQATAPLQNRIDQLEAKIASVENDRDVQQELIAEQHVQIHLLKSKIQEFETVFALDKTVKAPGEIRNDKAKKSKFEDIEVTKDSNVSGSGYAHQTGRGRATYNDAFSSKGIQHDPGMEKTQPRRRTIETPVAFEVRMSTTVKSFSLNQDIVFDTEITNIGAAYHFGHGLFVAPVHGIYVFSSSIMTQPGDHAEVFILVNGQKKGSIYSGSSDYEQGATAIVVELQIGEDVSLRPGHYQSTQIYGEMYSSFSGFLLTEIFSAQITG